jgi:hypothetical protein
MKFKLVEWIRWIWKIDWELVDVQATDYAGYNLLWPVYGKPYFIETWLDKRTGKTYIHEAC